MAHTRPSLNPRDLFEILHNRYVKDAALPLELVTDSLRDLNPEEILELCNLRPEAADSKNNANGLWLLLWNDLNQHSPILTDTLEEQLLTLPDDLFSNLDFSGAALMGKTGEGTEISSLQLLIPKTELLNKLFILPENKLKGLRLDVYINLNPARPFYTRVPGALLILIAHYYDTKASVDVEFQENFLRFAAFTPTFDNDFNLAIMDIFNNGGRFLLLELLFATNKLKRAAMKDQGSAFFAATDMVAEEICGNEIFSAHHYLFVDLIRSLVPGDHPRLPSEIIMLEKISLNKQTANFRNHANHHFLAKHLFFRPQDTLANKLQDLRFALGHAIKAWLLKKDDDISFILIVAEAFVYTDPANLNNNVRYVSEDSLLSDEFAWLLEKTYKITSRSSVIYTEKYANEVVNQIFSRLSLQREAVLPLYLSAQTSKVKEDNSELKKENAELKAKLQDAEKCIASISAKMQELEKKLERLTSEPKSRSASEETVPSSSMWHRRSLNQ